MPVPQRVTGSQALPGNRCPEALPRLQLRVGKLEAEPPDLRYQAEIGGRASGSALPGRAWERVEEQARCLFHKELI